MLAAAHRLRRSAEFAAAIGSGRRAGRGAVVVHLTVPAIDATPAGESSIDAAPATPATPDVTTQPVPARREATTLPPARAGFVVSKSVGGAVRRNRVRRRLRELVRARLDTFPAGTTLVVRALPSAAERSYRQLGTDLDGALAAARTPRRGGRRHTERERSVT